MTLQQEFETATEIGMSDLEGLSNIVNPRSINNRLDDVSTLFSIAEELHSRSPLLVPADWLFIFGPDLNKTSKTDIFSDTESQVLIDLGNWFFNRVGDLQSSKLN